MLTIREDRHITTTASRASGPAAGYASGPSSPGIEQLHVGSATSESTRSIPDVRRHNLSSTLRVIQRSAPVTRGDLIGSTGLSRVTVLDLVAELQTLQLIEETSPHNTGRGGRPARSLRMDSSVLAVGALEFNLGQVSFVWASLRGDSLGSLRVPIEVGHHDYDQMCSVAAALLHQAISSCSAEGRRLIHVTVGCLGVVNRSGGTVSSLALGWVDVPLAAELSRRTGADITYTVDPLAHLAVHAGREMGQWPDERPY